MTREIKVRTGCAPARLHASRLRTFPAGTRQPFARQLGVAGLATLAVIGTLAALQAGSEPHQDGIRPGPASSGSTVAPAPESKRHASPVSAPSAPSPEQAASSAAPPLAAPPAPVAVEAAAAPVTSQTSPAARIAAAPSNPFPPDTGDARSASPRPAAGTTLGEAIARCSVKPDPAAPTECLPPEFKALLGELAARFGRVSVVSTTQLHTDNHSRGSVRHRMHQACRAVDLRVEGDNRAVLRYLRSRPEVSGLNTYRNDLIHIDYAERRQTARGSARARSALAD